MSLKRFTARIFFTTRHPEEVLVTNFHALAKQVPLRNIFVRKFVYSLTSLTLAVRLAPPKITGGLSFKSSTVTARTVVEFLDGCP